MYRLTGYITLDHFCRYVLAGYFPCVNFQRQLYTCKCSFKSFIMMKLCKACRLLSFDDSEMFHFYRCIDQRTGTMTRVVLSHGQVTIQLVLSRDVGYPIISKSAASTNGLLFNAFSIDTFVSQLSRSTVKCRYSIRCLRRFCWSFTCW